MTTTLVALLVALALIPPPAQATWVWPTEGPPVVLRDFRAPLTPWGAGHRGVDLGASGDSIVAPTSGVVSFSGPVVDRGVLTIETPNGELISLEPVIPLVAVGEAVKRGQVIAVLEPGHCEQLCLHIGLRYWHGETMRYRSPRRELGIERRAVLLPWDYYALG